MATPGMRPAGTRISDTNLTERLRQLETPEIRAHKRRRCKRYGEYFYMPVEELQKAITREIGEGALLRGLDEIRGDR